MKKIINIDGMNCTHCIEKIQNALYGLPQVDDVNVSLDEKKAEVVFPNFSITFKDGSTNFILWNPSLVNETWVAPFENTSL